MSLICGLNPSPLPPHGTSHLTLSTARTGSYQFILTSLTQTLTNPSSSTTKGRPKGREDLSALTSAEWGNAIVGVVSDDVVNELMTPIQAGEGETNMKKSNAIRTKAEKTLNSEINWAMHMNVPAVIINPGSAAYNSTESSSSSSKDQDLNNLSRFLASATLGLSLSATVLWLSVPFCFASSISSSNNNSGGFDVIHNNLTTLLSSSDPSNTLGINLTFPSSTNEVINQYDTSHLLTQINRLIPLGIKAVTLDTACFIKNKKGFPTLTRKMQSVILYILERLGSKPRFIISGVYDDGVSIAEGVISSLEDGVSPYILYYQYLNHLRTLPCVTSVLDTPEAHAESNYLDYLQSPLQPLKDNLEFGTYEVFERDPVKYDNYRKAIELALIDGIHYKGYTSADADSVVVMVVGAGRGPLVNCAIQAIDNVNSNIVMNMNMNEEENENKNENKNKLVCKIVALEKNPSAVLFLQSLAQLDEAWLKHDVQVVSSDMRSQSKHKHKHSTSSRRYLESESDKADILISELLGSFGDNELSPECLDGAFAFTSGLTKSSCISIPASYKSYISPISSIKLASEVRAQSYQCGDARVGPGGMMGGMLKAGETPYVVRMHAGSQTHAEVGMFEFEHPNPSTKTKKSNITEDDDESEEEEDGNKNKRNERYNQVRFPSSKTYGLGYGSGYGPTNPTLIQESLESTERIDRTKIADDGSDSGVTIHGLSGTFDALLYKSVDGSKEERISIRPSTFSVGMFSWFPLYFPLPTPLYMPSCEGSELVVRMWRLTDERDGGRVWYEWQVETRVDGRRSAGSGVVNSGGRSYFVGL